MTNGIRLRKSRPFKLGTSEVLAFFSLCAAAYFGYQQIRNDQRNSIRTEELSAIHEVVAIASTLCSAYAPTEAVELWDYKINDFMPGVQTDPDLPQRSVGSLLKAISSLQTAISGAYKMQEEAEKLRILLYGHYTHDDPMQQFANYISKSSKEMSQSSSKMRAYAEDMDKKGKHIDVIDGIRWLHVLLRNQYVGCIEARNNIYSLYDIILPKRDFTQQE